MEPVVGSGKEGAFQTAKKESKQKRPALGRERFQFVDGLRGRRLARRRLQSEVEESLRRKKVTSRTAPLVPVGCRRCSGWIT